MTEGTERSTPKSRIESLSDLIFGLALSIGALTLIGQPPSDFTGLVLAILYYAFSFLILIRVWSSYTSTMSDLHFETQRAISTNITLLFLVSIEPFLFNQLLTSKIPAEYVSILFALDLGGLFAIQAFMASSILTDKNRPSQLLNHYRLLRNTLIIAAAIFFISTLPFFWTWSIPINKNTQLHIRFILWIAPLILPAIRRFFEKENK
jgi:uncharacterized membrane protein